MRWISTDGQVFENCAVFFRVKEEFGCLSNMAGGFPLKVNGIRVPSSEALYQAMRYPDHPEIQQEIIAQSSPMAAKMMSKKEGRRDRLTRLDWAEVQVDVMRWCLRVKLVQNFSEFVEVLMETENRPIVERSRKDPFWGAILKEDENLYGANQLGRLLSELRDEVEAGMYELEKDAPLPTVQPLAISNFRLLGQEIGCVA